MNLSHRFRRFENKGLFGDFKWPIVSKPAVDIYVKISSKAFVSFEDLSETLVSAYGG